MVPLPLEPSVEFGRSSAGGSPWIRRGQRACSQFENNYFTEMCSGSEAGSYLILTDFVYHSTLGLKVMKKKKFAERAAITTGPSRRANVAHISQSRPDSGLDIQVNPLKSCCLFKSLEKLLPLRSENGAPCQRRYQRASSWKGQPGLGFGV